MRCALTRLGLSLWAPNGQIFFDFGKSFSRVHEEKYTLTNDNLFNMYGAEIRVLE
jgi:hypothetical protein